MFVCVGVCVIVHVCARVCVCDFLHKFLSWPAGQDCTWESIEGMNNVGVMDKQEGSGLKTGEKDER